MSKTPQDHAVEEALSELRAHLVKELREKEELLWSGEPDQQSQVRHHESLLIVCAFFSLSFLGYGFYLAGELLEGELLELELTAVLSLLLIGCGCWSGYLGYRSWSLWEPWTAAYGVTDQRVVAVFEGVDGPVAFSYVPTASSQITSQPTYGKDIGNIDLADTARDSDTDEQLDALLYVNKHKEVVHLIRLIESTNAS